jgi:VanZ family protein
MYETTWRHRRALADARTSLSSARASSPTSSNRLYRYAMPLLNAALWGLAGLLLGAAVILSLSPAAGLGLVNGDKLLHVLGYFALTLSWLLAAVWVPFRGGGELAGGGGNVTLGLVLFSLVLEASQGAVGRNISPLDGLANVLGAATALWVWTVFRNKFSSRGWASR